MGRKTPQDGRQRWKYSIYFFVDAGCRRPEIKKEKKEDKKRERERDRQRFGSKGAKEAT